MSASQTARDRARAELTGEIKAEARRQLADAGAADLSLRAVARQLGMVSSALYRYFPSRDDLLTALIIDAYDALGEQAERAVAAAAPGPRGHRGRARWRACCHAVRDWAIARPHEYALIYGSPVPGYRAPRETVAPAARAAAVIGGVLRDAWLAGELAAGGGPGGPSAAGSGSGSGPGSLPAPLAGQAGLVAAAIAPGVPAPVMARSLIAWTQLFGMISFELFGQFVGSLEPADAFFAWAVDQMADYAGLPA
jgi:AcrR family transcriptional regulator